MFREGLFRGHGGGAGGRRGGRRGRGVYIKGFNNRQNKGYTWAYSGWADF